MDSAGINHLWSDHHLPEQIMSDLPTSFRAWARSVWRVSLDLWDPFWSTCKRKWRKNLLRRQKFFFTWETRQECFCPENWTLSTWNRKGGNQSSQKRWWWWWINDDDDKVFIAGPDDFIPLEIWFSQNYANMNKCILSNMASTGEWKGKLWEIVLFSFWSLHQLATWDNSNTRPSMIIWLKMFQLCYNLE